MIISDGQTSQYLVSDQNYFDRITYDIVLKDTFTSPALAGIKLHIL